MIALNQVGFAYNAGRDDAIVALSDINLSINQGELVALLGHNGSGKSTLAKLMAAVHFATSGSITVNNITADESHAYDVRRAVGLVFQRPDDQLIASRVVDDIALRRPTLDDVFLSLTGHIAEEVKEEVVSGKGRRGGK